MSVGEALAQARIRAGLTIEEVSERSLIRASVIGSMESDDYDACGGPIYVNGYIRAIATAIGADPAPLIRSYAASRGPHPVPAAGPGVPGPDHVTEPDPPADPGSAASAADPADTLVDLVLPPLDDQPPAAEQPPTREQHAGEPPTREQPVAEQPPAGQQPAGEQPPAEGRAQAESEPTAHAQATPAARTEATPHAQPAGPEQTAGQEQPAGPEQTAGQAASSPAPSAESGPGASPEAPAETRPDAGLAPPAGARPLARPIPPAKATAPQPIAHGEPAAPAQTRPNPRPAYSQPAAPAEPGEKAPPLRPRPAAAATSRPGMRQEAPPSRTGQPRPPRTRERRRVRWAAGLAVLPLVLLGFAGREIFASVHHGHPQDAAAANPVSTHSSAAPSPVPSPTSPAPSPSPTPSPSASQPSVQSLTPASAMAFGPSGTSDGDNPSIADRALTRAESGWQSNWYVTPAFGALKQGTGLMVDMGAVVSITGVEIQLGSLPGATIELGVGDEPVMSAMHMVQRVTGAGGRVVLPLTAVKARYFLIWFTQLPPDGAGHYQATIDGIAVQGYR